MSGTDILKTLAEAMTPIGELRLAIPRAIISRDATWYEAYFWSVLGNLVPVVFLLWWLGPVSRFLERFPNPGAWLLRWRARRLREGSAELFERWGPWALIPFVAIPLPVTGAWTGSLAAWAFGMRRPVALLAITAGVLIAGVIVTAVTEITDDFPLVNV